MASLYGRDAAVAILTDALLPGTITAVVGPPGVGKTRLVAAIAAGHEQRLWVDVAAAHTVTDLWASLGNAAGVTLSRPDDAPAALAAALSAKPALLVVLDAAEHLDEVAWVAIDALCRALAAVTWAVTSVVRPAAGVRVLELGPLPAGPAVELLVARATERALDQAPDPADPAWATLAARLDGLPLALELAAGRFGVLTAAQIVERLDRPNLLAGGRHGTLSGALRYAWSLLGDADRQALAACGVFRGGFDLAAAEAVLGEDALDRLSALRERSALAWRDGRFYVLEGLRRLAEAEGGPVVAEAAARHRAYYADYGLRLRKAILGGQSKAALAALRVEMPNLEAAFRAARDVDPPQAAQLAGVWLRSLRSHGPMWRVDALGDLDRLAVDPELALDLVELHADVLHLGGDLDRSAARSDRGIALAEAAGAPQLLVRALERRASIHYERAEVDATRALLARAAALCVDPFDTGCVLNSLGCVELMVRDHDAAEAAFLAAIDNFRAANSQRLMASAWLNLGGVRADQRRFAEARAHFEAASECAPGEPGLAVTCANNLAQVAMIEGDLEAADAHLAVAYERSEATGWALARAKVTLFRAICAWLGGDRPAAIAGFADAAAQNIPGSPNHIRALAWRLAAEEPAPAAALDQLDRWRTEPGNDELFDFLRAWFAGGPLPPEPKAESTDVQLVRKLLRRAPAGWTVHADGRWFEGPDGRVDLSRRGSMRRILGALARLDRAADGLSVPQLFEAGWPGERAGPEAAAGRVYTAIRELRGLGLEPVLRREAEGYRLDPTIAIDVVS